MSEKTELALAYSSALFNCAQAVLTPFAEDYDLEAETALRVAGGLGGGLRCGEVCGAVSGGVLVVGLAKGQYIENDTGAKQNCRAATKAFTDAFRDAFGCLRCFDLIGIDTSTDEGYARFHQSGLFETHCKGYIKKAVEILEEQGY